MEDKTLLLVDGNSLITASYFALPELHTSGGVPTNALRGFVDTVCSLIEEYKPSHMLVAFDSMNNKRKQKHPDYKASRKPLDAELYEQYPYIEEFLELMNISMRRKDGYEADDIIASATVAFNQDIPIVIATRDKDMFRLCCFKNVRIAYYGASGRLIDSGGVITMLGVTPEQVSFFKALSGDPSDNVKGVPGIGKVTAAKLLGEYGDLSTIVKEAQADNITPPRIGKLIRENLQDLAKSYELVQFLELPVTTRLSELTLDIPEDKAAMVEFFERMEFTI